jgi:hypothetical protein
MENQPEARLGIINLGLNNIFPSFTGLKDDGSHQID